jgi:hypothetical protein
MRFKNQVCNKDMAYRGPYGQVLVHGVTLAGPKNRKNSGL